MILVDVNLLVYAWDLGSPQHKVAQHWLDARLSEPSRVALPWQSTLGRGAGNTGSLGMSDNSQAQ